MIEAKRNLKSGQRPPKIEPTDYMDTTVTPQTIRSFPESSLPESVHDRLEMLFRVREKWTVDEIAPYVESLTTPILNVNGLLTKFARAANVNGKKVFCSKHGK